MEFKLLGLNGLVFENIIGFQNEIENLRLPNQYPITLYSKEKLKDFTIGGNIIGAFSNNNLAGISCYMGLNNLFFKGRISNEHKHSNFENSSYLTFILVHPKFRGNGLQRDLMTESEYHMKKSGFDKSYIAVNPINLISKKNILQSEYKFTSKLTRKDDLNYFRELYHKQL